MIIEKKYRVLVVDDSPFMRNIITRMLEEDPRLKVIDTAMNGKMALEKVKVLNPDILTLDVEMPIMDGLETLKELRKFRQVPVIMFSSLTKSGADVTIKALELGAFDFVQKPETTMGTKTKEIKDELISKIIAALNSYNVSPEIFSKPPERSVNVDIDPSVRQQSFFRMSKVIRTDKFLVIGSSTGGPRAVKQLLSALPKNFPARILIVQHMPPKFTESFAQRLNNLCDIDVFEAKDGDVPEPGKAYLAPGDYHMVLDKDGIIRLNQGPEICGLRPAVDVTLDSVSNLYKNDVFFVVLTGMGHDGTKGASIVKENGGYCIAEHESTCTVYGMPKSVIDAGYADSIAPLHNIPEEIFKYLEKKK